MDSLFEELKRDLKRLNWIGVPKVMITNLHPIQCTPYYTRPTNYSSCAFNVSASVAGHNRRVDALMRELDGASNTTFLALDVNTAMSNVLLQGQYLDK